MNEENEHLLIRARYAEKRMEQCEREMESIQSAMADLQMRNAELEGENKFLRDTIDSMKRQLDKSNERILLEARDKEIRCLKAKMKVKSTPHSHILDIIELRGRCDALEETKLRYQEQIVRLKELTAKLESDVVLAERMNALNERERVLLLSLLNRK